MVNLLEYQGKELFKKYGINIPHGFIAKDVSHLKPLHGDFMLKAQVPTGHRNQSGGVIEVHSRREAKAALQKLKNIDFNGFKPSAFLIEQKIPHSVEFYISIALDRSRRAPVIIVSKNGGVDIEKVPKENISVFPINKFIGIPDYVVRAAAEFITLNKMENELGTLLKSMWELYSKEDAELVEINPLVSEAGVLTALDSKIVIEDDALFRHNYEKSEESSDSIEIEAIKKGISFVRLEGNIGLIANGAGLTMATIDQININGGHAGNFLDLGGTDDPSKVAEAIELVNEEKPKVLFINIFGGVTKADTVAKGIIKAIKKFNPAYKIIVRLRGFNEEEGKKLLNDNGIKAFTDIEEAIKEAVGASKL